MTIPQLKIVFWETTSACNLGCVHCRRLDVRQTSSESDLSTGEALRLMEAIREVGKPTVIFSGGEPLLRSDIFEIARHADCLGLGVALATNGTLIDSVVAGKIKENSIRRVSVSLDGADAATHDAFRQVTGSFARALAGIEELKRAGIEFQINATITKVNVAQLAALYELACQIGARALHIFMLVPVGCGVEMPESARLSPEEYEKALLEFYEISLRGQIETRATCAPQYYRILAQRSRGARSTRAEGEAPSARRGCLAGYAVCFVSHTGEVFPCGYLPVSAGNVRSESFKKVWDGAKVFQDLRDQGLLRGKCGACEYRAVCMGCRARAFASTGDYLSEEPDCVYIPRGHAEGS
jgi:heme b synthase